MTVLLGQVSIRVMKDDIQIILELNIRYPLPKFGNQVKCWIMELTFCNRVLVDFQSMYFVSIRNYYMGRIYS